MNKALILIDFINEIVHLDGKLAAKGYADYMQEFKVIEKLNTAIQKARSEGLLIIHVKVGFSEDYTEQPKSSPLFSKVHEYQALKLNTWATEFHKDLDVQSSDIIVIKHRVNAFFNTELDTILKERKIDSLYIAGVATDLAVSNTARDAHDRDYNVTILKDCCAAANQADHDSALLSLSKIAIIQDSSEIC